MILATKAGIDGMTIDTMGNIYATVRSAKRFGIAAYTPRGKEIRCPIPTETLPTNCCFGVGAEANTLYITAGIGLYRIEMNVAGFHPPTAPLAQRSDSGWVSLFDGNTANGWTPRGEVEFLKAVDGELHLYSTKNVWVVSDAHATDFEAQLEVKLPAQSESKGDHFNSGLGFQLIGEKETEGLPMRDRACRSREKRRRVRDRFSAVGSTRKARSKRQSLRQPPRDCSTTTTGTESTSEWWATTPKPGSTAKWFQTSGVLRHIVVDFGIQHHGSGGTVNSAAYASAPSAAENKRK